MWTPQSQLGIATDGPTISSSLSPPSTDSHQNFMWIEDNSEGINSGEHFWTFQFGQLDDHATAVGLSNDSRFGQGYSLRGLMCHYNLFDGGSLLVMQFCPGISSGDKMGLLATLTEDVGRLKIYLYHNDRPLGLAFNVPASTLPNARPVISTSGTFNVTIKKETVIPIQRTRRLLQFTGIEGSWKAGLDKIEINGTKLSTQDRDRFLKDVTMKIRTDDPAKKNFYAHLHVVNSISMSLEKTDKSWKSIGGSSTLMLGSPFAMEVETAMSDLCDDPDSVELSGDDQTMTIKRGTSSAIFVRYDDSPGPYEGDPFERCNR